MSDKRAPRRSLDDWMELVTECRQSGLTDAAWCEAQGISPSCFYNAVGDISCLKSVCVGTKNTSDLAVKGLRHYFGSRNLEVHVRKSEIPLRY